MQMLMSIAIVVQIIAAIAVIILVLLQHGKGADLGAAFGSGASGSLFGATGSANFLSPPRLWLRRSSSAPPLLSPSALVLSTSRISSVKAACWVR